MSITGTASTVGFTPTSTTPTPPEDFSAVLYIQQTLTAAQKLQALVNIGAVGTADVATLVSSVTFDSATMQLQVGQNNGTTVAFDLSQNQGINDVDLDANNDLVVGYLDGYSKIIPLADLLSGFVTTVNNKTGSSITIDIDDINNLRDELNSRVATGITIEIDGETKNLESNPVFDTQSVKYVDQTLSKAQKEIVHANLDVYSKQEVIDLIEASTTTTEALFEHLLTPADLANAIITFTLPQPIKGNSKGFMYIGSAPVSPNSYEINGATLKIDQTTFDYELQANRRLIFRYNS